MIAGLVEVRCAGLGDSPAVHRGYVLFAGGRCRRSRRAVPGESTVLAGRHITLGDKASIPCWPERPWKPPARRQVGAAPLLGQPARGRSDRRVRRQAAGRARRCRAGSFTQASSYPTSQSNAATVDLNETLRAKSIGFMLFFPVVAGIIGLGIGAWPDGIMCRLPRIIIAGGIGLIVGLIGGFISSMLAGMVYNAISTYALKNNPGAGIGGLSIVRISPADHRPQPRLGPRRSCAMGLGQGLALRSSRIVVYGLLGGLLGGLFGGILFDPIDFLPRRHQPQRPSRGDSFRCASSGCASAG